MKNIVAFIPARGGSKSILGKNVKLLGDKPLIAYSIESAIKAGLRPIVNTDFEEIADIAKEYGAEVMLRPSSLAGDKTSMYEVLKSEVPKIFPIPDAVILLQPTSPFRSKNHINNALGYFQSSEEYDSLISVEKVPEKYNPAQMIISTQTGKGMIMGKTPLNKLMAWIKGIKHSLPSLSGVPISSRLTRRQDFPEAWIPTGSFYIFKTSNLDKGSIYGDKVMLYESESSININTQADWDVAEAKLKNA